MRHHIADKYLNNRGGYKSAFARSSYLITQASQLSQTNKNFDGFDIHQPSFHSLIIPGRLWGVVGNLRIEAFHFCPYGVPVRGFLHVSWIFSGTLHLRLYASVPDDLQPVSDWRASRSCFHPRAFRAQSRFEDDEAVDGAEKWSLTKLGVERAGRAQRGFESTGGVSVAARS